MAIYGMRNPLEDLSSSCASILRIQRLFHIHQDFRQGYWPRIWNQCKKTLHHEHWQCFSLNTVTEARERNALSAGDCALVPSLFIFPRLRKTLSFCITPMRRRASQIDNALHRTTERSIPLWGLNRHATMIGFSPVATQLTLRLT